jgi:hypothetical protein
MDLIIKIHRDAERILREHLEQRHTVPEYVWFSVRVVEDKDCLTCSKIIIDYEFENVEGGLDNPTICGSFRVTLEQWRHLI